MDILFTIAVVLYAILMIVLLLFNIIAIRHILKYRFKGDVSMAVLLGYIVVVGILILVTTFSLLALSFVGSPGGWL